MLSSPSVCVCVDGRHWEGLIGTFVWLSTAISRALMVLYMSLLALFLLSCHVCFRRAFVARGRHSTDIVHLAQQGTKTKALRSAVVGQGFERKGKGEFKWFGFCRSSQPQLRVWEFKKSWTEGMNLLKEGNPSHARKYKNPCNSTGLSKRNGAKLRESFCQAAASHSRSRQAGA